MSRFTIGGPHGTKPFVAYVSKTVTISKKGEEPRDESSRHVMLMWAKDAEQAGSLINGWHKSRGTKDLEFELFEADPNHHVGSKAVALNEKLSD